jgi:nucleotide-binding universal stress UspA family protein
MRVLLAVDGSAPSATARDLLAAVEWPADSELLLLSAIEPVNVLFASPWAPAVATNIDSLDQQLTQQAESLLEETARLLAQTGCDIERIVVRGRPASAIVERAAAWRADMIVMGSRGHGTIASMLLGSVTAEVVDHAPCPVLVARLPVLTRAVLAVDGSECARVAEELVASSGIFERVALEVTSVAPAGLPWRTGSAPAMVEAADISSALDVELKLHTTIANEAAERLRVAGRRASPLIVQGDPAAELMRVAEDSQAELIVLGTHGRTGLTRALLGSVARNVMLHAHCSVLVVRSQSGLT